jgi:uncharacterized membrane protein YhaH (DUF805 family)
VLVSIGVWQVIILFLVGVVVIGIPWVAIWTENTEARVGRQKFAVWMFSVLVFAFMSDVVLKTASQDAGMMSVAIILSVIAGSVVLQFAFARAIARRARDAGHEKRLAYLSLIPIINLVLILYLALRGSAPAGASA